MDVLTDFNEVVFNVFSLPCKKNSIIDFYHNTWYNGRAIVYEMPFIKFWYIRWNSLCVEGEGMQRTISFFRSYISMAACVYLRLVE